MPANLISTCVTYGAISELLMALIGRLMKRSQDEIVSLIYTGGMRNISAGAVLAVSFFPSQVAVPVVIGMLFQQILAALFGYLLRRFELKPVVMMQH